MDVRLKVTDRYVDYVEGPNIGSHALKEVVRPNDAAELARIGNDELAELATKHLDRFVGAIACLPMNDIDATQ